MKKQLRNIAATILSLTFAMPFALHADEPYGVRTTESQEFNTDNFINENYNQAEDLLTLDEEALQELSEMGYELFGGNNELAASIIDYAAQYLGRPYRHGAKGPSSFDCSGFTSFVFKEYGINLSPSSKMQATQGRKISTSQVQPGDLLFFGGRAGGSTVGHVALAVDVDDDGTITFIHASTSQGITYNRYPDGGYYSKRYLGARRVIE